MTQQAKNCLGLFKGNDPSKVKQALKYQATSIVRELMQFTGTDNIDNAAVALSNGDYCKELAEL